MRQAHHPPSRVPVRRWRVGFEVRDDRLAPRSFPRAARAAPTGAGSGVGVGVAGRPVTGPTPCTTVDVGRGGASQVAAEPGRHRRSLTRREHGLCRPQGCGRHTLEEMVSSLLRGWEVSGGILGSRGLGCTRDSCCVSCRTRPDTYSCAAAAAAATLQRCGARRGFRQCPLGGPCCATRPNLRTRRARASWGVQTQGLPRAATLWQTSALNGRPWVKVNDTRLGAGAGVDTFFLEKKELASTLGCKSAQHRCKRNTTPHHDTQ